MLVLKRFEDERIVLDFTQATDAEIAALRQGLTVIDVVVSRFAGGPAVHLGIEAPKGVTIDRREVYEAKLREAAEAAA